MLRYLAFTWNCANEPACAAARLLQQKWGEKRKPWQHKLICEGMSVYWTRLPTDAAQECLMEHNAGVVLGTLFRRGPQSDSPSIQCTDLNDRETDAILASSGQHLIQRYWGSYIALFKDSATRMRRLLVSPVGSLPCFHSQFQGVDVFYSRMEDSLDLGLSYSFNWNYISAHLAVGGISGQHTALNEVTEVKPGEAFLIDDSGNRRIDLLWNPARIATTEVLDDASVAARRVRDCALACVHSVAALYEEITLYLSGGLDSSIVCSLLNEVGANSRVTCVNLYTDGSNSDERHFARLVAKRASSRLIEVKRREIELERCGEAAHTAIIYGYSTRMEHARTAESIRESFGEVALFTGNGGDEIFDRNGVEWAARDFLCTRGLRPSLARVCFDVAFLNRLSIWHVLWKSIRRQDGPAAAFDGLLTGWRARAAEKGLLNQEVIAALDGNPECCHPWLHHLGKLPPGKVRHILALSTKCNDNPFAKPDEPEIVNPLMSQPLVELCLQIPSYVHIRGGVDRAVARQAFVDILPPEIIDRTTKGGCIEHDKRLLARNLSFVREILGNGTLVRRKLVDPRRITAVLSDRPSRSKAISPDVMNVFNVEFWLRQWLESGRASLGEA